MSFRRQDLQPFRVTLPALWRVAFPLTLFGGLTALLHRWLMDRPVTWPGTLPFAGVALVAVLLIWALQPTMAGAPGVLAMNVWGVRRPMRWNEITDARLARLLWLMPAIRLRDSRGRTLWIPRDTRHLGRLHALALQHGGPAHPLTQVLQTPLHAL